MASDCTLAESTEVGSLNVPHLKRIWSAAIATLNGVTVDRSSESDLDRTVLNAVGLGLHQTIQYLFHTAPSFDEFEEWIVTTAGQPDSINIVRLAAIISGQPRPESANPWVSEIEQLPPVLTDNELSHWAEHGYVVLKKAVSKQSCLNAEKAIWEYVNASPNDPETWYNSKVDHGIMVELIQHPAFEANRRCKRIHKAFSQLWGTADLWVSADRAGFHPPQREGHPFPGPDLHWDINLAEPLRFGTQGILYLSDTPPERGALTVVPGFHKQLEQWLQNLPPDVDPQQQDLHALGSKPIGAAAGDMVIWNQFLPHGSRPNHCRFPRIVQYINWRPCEYSPISE